MMPKEPSRDEDTSRDPWFEAAFARLVQQAEAPPEFTARVRAQVAHLHPGVRPPSWPRRVVTWLGGIGFPHRGPGADVRGTSLPLATRRRLVRGRAAVLATVLLLSLSLNAWLGYRVFTPHQVDEPPVATSGSSIKVEVPPGRLASSTVELRPWPWGPRLDMPLFYSPPLRSTGERVVSRTARRGRGDAWLRLSVLAPDHTGLTIHGEPSLYYQWSLGKAAAYPVDVELTIMEDPAMPPLLKARLGSPGQPGQQRVRLADHAVSLSPGVRYEWFVTLITDPDNRATDLTAGGAIERVAQPFWLLKQLTGKSRADTPRIYAWAGVWYDAFNALANLLDAAPNDPELRKQRHALLP